MLGGARHGTVWAPLGWRQPPIWVGRARLEARHPNQTWKPQNCTANGINWTVYFINLGATLRLGSMIYFITGDDEIFANCNRLEKCAAAKSVPSDGKRGVPPAAWVKWGRLGLKLRRRTS